MFSPVMPSRAEARSKRVRNGPLVEPVDPLDLLLLTELDSVIGLLAPPCVGRAVLTGRVPAPLYGALLRVATSVPSGKSFCPSRLQSLQTGPVYRAMLFSSRPGASWAGGIPLWGSGVTS